MPAFQVQQEELLPVLFINQSSFIAQLMQSIQHTTANATMQLLHGWTVSKLRTCMYIYGVRLQGEYVVPCNEVELVALVPSIHIYTFYIGPTMAN